MHNTSFWIFCSSNSYFILFSYADLSFNSHRFYKISTSIVSTAIRICALLLVMMFKLMCLQDDASKMIKCTSTEQFGSYLKGCGLCGGAAHSFKVLSGEPESVRSGNEMVNPELREKVIKFLLNLVKLFLTFRIISMDLWRIDVDDIGLTLFLYFL